jgi:hypothetical protein
VGLSAQAKPDIEMLLSRVGERVARYYKSAQNLICIEKSTVQPIGWDMSPHGFARVTESEMRVETDIGEDGTIMEEPRVFRELRKINGRLPRERDKNDRAGCTDPNPLSAEPLAFLLPANRREFQFAAAGFGKGKESNALIIEYTKAEPRGHGELIEDPRGHPDCFSVSVPVTLKGRIWVDARTYEVIRIEQHIAGPGDIRVSDAQQRKHNLPASIVIERYDTTIKYRSVAFADPEEAMLLPESIDIVAVYRGGLESLRRRQAFSEYRRFLTAGRVVK